MITKVILRNFQKHKKMEVDLEQVTVLIGRTDCGKSSVVRALRWVITNQPKGTHFIRRGADKCSVTIHVDGHVIKRVRSQKTNLYFLDGQKFASFKNEPPEPILNVLRITPESFQQQHDPVFWLSLSPSEVSRRLNEIADLQMMDTAVREGARRKRETAQKLKWLKDQKRQAKEERNELSDVPAMAAEFQELQQLEKTIEETREKHARLISLAARLEKLQTKAADIETGLADWQEIYLLHQKMEPDRKRLAELERLQSQLATYERQLVQCSKALQTQKESVAKTSVKCPTCGRPMPQ